MKKVLVLLILLFQILQIHSQNTVNDELKEFREFVENERKLHRESVNELEKTIRQERKDHMDFVESIFKWGTIISGGLLAVVGFFGFKTFKDIQEAEKKLRTKADNELKAADKRIQKIQGDLNLVQLQYLDQRKEILNRINDAEGEYQKLIDSINFKLQLHRGIVTIICLAEDKMKRMKEEEIKWFDEKVGLKLPAFSTIPDNLNGYDVIIYRSNVDKNGEDPSLITLFNELSKFNDTIPVVIYAKGKDEFIQGATEKRKNEYLLHHLANAFIPLVDNVSAAYRVKKLAEKQR